jgi:hypothetical protein
MAAVYEQLLDDRLDWALREASLYFEGQGAVNRTLHDLAKRLDELGIPYAIAGGMALFAHGFRRFTEVVDVLVTREGLADVHRHLDGLGYTPVFAGSKALRDVESGVRIDFLVAGDYPGDGRPKPVSFPAPEAASVEIDGVRWLRLPALVELKLASGMTNPGRLRDVADVQELIRACGLPAEFAEQLQPFVREKYRELWEAVQSSVQ